MTLYGLSVLKIHGPVLALQLLPTSLSALMETNSFKIYVNSFSPSFEE